MREKKLRGVRPSFQISQGRQDRPVCTDLYRALLASVPVHRAFFFNTLYCGTAPGKNGNE